jgi:hypothetical protein
MLVGAALAANFSREHSGLKALLQFCPPTILPSYNFVLLQLSR